MVIYQQALGFALLALLLAACSGGGSSSSGSKITLVQGETFTRQISMAKSSYYGSWEGCAQLDCKYTQSGYTSPKQVELRISATTDTRPGTHNVRFYIKSGGSGCAPFVGCIDLPIKTHKTLKFRIKVVAARTQVTASAVHQLPATPRSVWGSDVNGDSRVDIIATSDEKGESSQEPVHLVFLAQADGRFKPAGDFDHADTAVGDDPLDFNNDSLKDVIEVRERTIEVLLGRGNDFFDSSGALTLEFAVGVVSATDINGDGILDLLVAQQVEDALEMPEASAIVVFLGDGVGGFHVSFELSVAAGISGIYGADFDSNGLVDFAVIDAAASELKIYLR